MSSNVDAARRSAVHTARNLNEVFGEETVNERTVQPFLTYKTKICLIRVKELVFSVLCITLCKYFCYEYAMTSPDCSKPSLIRIYWGEVIRINNANDSPKRKEKLRKQINGNINNLGSADENK
jgi:hypothetical protein